jgi:hypothetical protein
MFAGSALGVKVDIGNPIADRPLATQFQSSEPSGSDAC